MIISENRLKQIIKEELDGYMIDNLARLYRSKDEEQREQAKEILFSLDKEDRNSFITGIEPWRELLPDDLMLAEPEDLFKMRLVNTTRASRSDGSWRGTKWIGGGINLKRTFDIELNGQKIGTFVDNGGKAAEVEIFGQKARVSLDYKQTHFNDKKFKGYVIYEPRPKGKNNKKNVSIERSGLMAYGGLISFLKTKSGQKWFLSKRRKNAVQQYKAG